MLEKIFHLLKSNDLCVLATCSKGKPLCSLMTYLVEDEGPIIYMVTRKDTTKFLNLMDNRQVSLLVDNRSNKRDNLQQIISITIEGIFTPLTNAAEEKRIGNLFKEKYPHLQGLLDDPLSIIIPVKVISFLLLEGPEKASHVRIAEDLS